MTYEFRLPVRNQELVRLIAIGDYSAVRDTIHQLGADPATPTQTAGQSSSPRVARASISLSTPAATPHRQSRPQVWGFSLAEP
ncbi:hypothetical protein [Nodosilinea sp. LEGE 07298]|uniref:hypothetical protein n=1 Tax=Nodosilinea sp. LEGE 07298 TaxID=2777970 RepID=UPI001D1445CE|nr:hypothetical protein [Nodosilinea sp. LEGE 07298]